MRRIPGGAIGRVLADRGMCVDMSASIFDATEGRNVLEALKACNVCPVVKECEDFVRPKRSFFDGVCAGKVWVDGIRVDVFRQEPLPGVGE